MQCHANGGLTCRTLHKSTDGGRYKFFILLALTCLSCAAFAQNVKPYTVDLNSIPASNGKTVTHNKANHTFTIKGNAEEWKGIGYYPAGGIDISNYNIVRIKYKVPGDYGFHLGLDYADESISGQDEETYCPSYLTEMVIPLIPGQKKLNGINFAGTWYTEYEQFSIQSITFENVPNPERTNIHASDEPPVIDTATTGTFNDSLTAWDFVQTLGAGYQYQSFSFNTTDLDFGMDFYHPWGEPKLTKEFIDFIRNKGFTTLRLMFNPGNHFVDDKHTVDPRFIKELKQATDWALEDGMNVILCGFFWGTQFRPDYNPDRVRYEGVIANEKYQKQGEELLTAVWKQIATAFNNSYDERLIFETLNECGDDLHPEHNHNPQESCAVCKKDFGIINRYNQVILDTIRASGGNNAKRFVMVESYGASADALCSKLFKLPKDKAKNKLIPTFHYYPMGATPEGIKMFYTRGIKQQISSLFEQLDKTYFSKHIPVYISEIGTLRAIPLLEKINYVNDLMAEVTKEGRSCATTHHFDGGYAGGDPGPTIRYYNRKTMTWEQSEYLDSYIYAARRETYPLSDAFIRKNEVKVASIVGKNLLDSPLEIHDFDKSFGLNPDSLVRSVPATYKLEITVDKLASDAILQIGFMDLNQKWHEIVNEKNVTITGGSSKDGWCIAVKDETVTITVDEALAVGLESAQSIGIGGKNVRIKSIKIVE